MTGDLSRHFVRDRSVSSADEASGSAARGWIFDIKKYAIHDGPGIRTTVFFKGCPLRCRWCHNPESWQALPEPSLRRGRCVRCGRCVQTCDRQAIGLNGQYPVTDPDKCTRCGACVDGCLAGAREIIGRDTTVGQVMAEIEKDVIFYDESGGGATFSGGEPLMQPEFLLALLNQCRARGIHTAVDTTCHAESGLVRRVAEVADLFLCDIKHMDGDAHRRCTGVDNGLILDNIAALAKAGKAVVIRVPVVPGFNDGAANIERTADFVRSLRTVGRIDILPYNRGGQEKAVRLAADFDLMQAQPPDNARMAAIAAILTDRGFEVKTGG